MSKTQVLLVGALVAALPLPGQARVADLEPGPNGSFPTRFVAIAGGAVFVATTSTHGTELWFSDGTAAGTRALDIWNGPRSGLGEIRGVARLANRAIVAASDGAAPGLFATDGTIAGTRLLGRLRMASGAPPIRITTPLARLGDRLVFAAGGRNGEAGLFVTDGSAAGTSQYFDLTGAGAPSEVAVAGDLAAFHGSGDLWLTDGSAAGTRRVASGGPGGGSLHDVALFAGGHALMIERSRPNRAPDRIVRYDPASGTITPVRGLPNDFPAELHALHAPGRAVANLVDSQGHSVVVGIDPVSGAIDAPVSLGEGFGTTWVAHDVAWVTTGPLLGRIWKCDGTAAGTGAVWPPVGAPPMASGSALIPVGANRVLFTEFLGSSPVVRTTDGVRTRGMPGVGPLDAQGEGPHAALVPELGDAGLVFYAANDARGDLELWAMPLPATGAAAFATVDAACAANTAPRLSARPATLGDARHAIDIASSSPNSLAALFFGVRPAAGAVGCGPAVDPLAAVLLTTDPAGAASLPLPVPNAPALLGLRLFVAGAVARSGGSFGGVADVSALHALIVGE